MCVFLVSIENGAGVNKMTNMTYGARVIKVCKTNIDQATKCLYVCFFSSEKFYYLNNMNYSDFSCASHSGIQHKTVTAVLVASPAVLPTKHTSSTSR